MSLTPKERARLEELLPGFDPTKVPPVVAPLAPVMDHPRWSVMIPTFNCAALLRQTLASVLRQDPGAAQMQIEVVDDCSTKDDPEAVVREIGGGRVQFFRQPANRGVTGNFNTCVERSRGELVHILHGDDVVEPGFYARVAAAAAAHADVAAFFVRCRVIDEDGTLDYVAPRLRRLATPTRTAAELIYSNPLFTPGIVIRRSFYQAHRGFLPSLSHVADWEMWVRAVSRGGGLWINELLASYRYFAANDTNRLARTAENMRDRLRAGWVFSTAFPDFSLARFERSVAVATRRQLQRFVTLGDREAVAANRAMYHVLATPARRQLHEAWDVEHEVRPLLETTGPAPVTPFVARAQAALANRRSIHIWGAGQAGIGALRTLQAAGVSVAAFIDSDARKRGSLVVGLPVTSPADLTAATPRPFVVVASMYAAEIQRTLTEMNFPAESDHVVV